jgi:hypothetical protein
LPTPFIALDTLPVQVQVAANAEATFKSATSASTVFKHLM